MRRFQVEISRYGVGGLFELCAQEECWPATREEAQKLARIAANAWRPDRRLHHKLWSVAQPRVVEAVGLQCALTSLPQRVTWKLTARSVPARAASSCGSIVQMFPG